MATRDIDVEEAQSQAINTVFGYKKIAWKIVDYLSWTSGNKWIIRSPEFCIQGPQLTKWRLCLTLKLINAYYRAKVNLERCECDSFADDVQARWKLCFPVSGGKVVMTERTETFPAKCGLRFHAFEMVAVEHEMVSEGKPDDFVVRCSIIVYSVDDRKILERSNDSGLKSLSQDLLVLLRVNKLFDAKLQVGRSYTIDIHKAVVCSRNRLLNSLIESNEIDNFVFHGNLDTARRMISFLYTGDLKHVLRLPSFSDENAVEYLNIDELKPYYSPVELTVQTKMILRETKFVWMVAYLNDLRCIWSHRMIVAGRDKSFRVALYPRGFSGKKDYMSLKLEFQERLPPGRMNIHVGILDINKKYGNVKVMRRSPRDDRHIVLEQFISRSILNDPVSTDKGKLKLVFRIGKAVGSASSVLAENETCPAVSINKDTHYNILSKDISSLYKTGDYSDYTIESGTFRFRVHKIIISCRSHVLASMIANESNTNSLSLPDIEPDILNRILYYLYSGVLEECDSHKMLKIYDASKRFGILSLKNTCSRILQENFEIQNAVKILIAAYEHKDWKLKPAVLKFIASNMNDIQTQECWKTLKDEHSTLYEEVTKFANSHMC